MKFTFIIVLLILFTQSCNSSVKKEDLSLTETHFTDVKKEAQYYFKGQNNKMDVFKNDVYFKPLVLANVSKNIGVHYIKVTTPKTFHDELYLNAAIFDSIEVYQYQNKKWVKQPQKSGILLPINKRPNDIYRTCIAPLKSSISKNNTYILALHSSNKFSAIIAPVSFKLGFQLFTYEGLSYFKTNKVFSSIYVGILMVLLLLNFAAFFIAKKKGYLYLSLFCLNLLITILLTSGISYELKIFQDNSFTRMANLYSWALFPIIYLLFGKSYLKIKKKLPLAHQFFNGLLILNIFVIFSFVFIPITWVYLLGILIFPINAIFLLIVSLKLNPLKYVPAAFVVVASSIFIIGGMYGWVMLNFYSQPFLFTENVILGSMVIQVFVFNIAIYTELKYSEIKMVTDLTEKLKLEKELNDKSRELVSLNTYTSMYEKELHKLVEAREDENQNDEDLKKHLSGMKNLNLSWEKTKLHFEAVYPNFYNKLVELHPELTQHELRLLSYLKMNLTSKEISKILSITEPSVGIARNRLRKKLDLPKGSSIQNYLARF